MISTVVAPQSKANSSNGAALQSLWRRSPNQHQDAITSSVAPEKSQPKKLRPKVGRQFFEHDTRQNYFAKAKRRNKPLQRSPPIQRRPDTTAFNRYMSSLNSNDPLMGAQVPFADHSSTSSRDSKSPIPSITSLGQGSSPHRAPNSPEAVNNKLRKKLLKIQRQLRIQTEALRQHQLLSCAPAAIPAIVAGPSATGCCCSCAFIGEEQHVNVSLMQKRFHHHQQHMRQQQQHHQVPGMVPMETRSTMFDCNGGNGHHHHGAPDMDAGPGVVGRGGALVNGPFHPFRMQGLRSVVR